MEFRFFILCIAAVCIGFFGLIRLIDYYFSDSTDGSIM